MFQLPHFTAHNLDIDRKMETYFGELAKINIALKEENTKVTYDHTQQ